MKTAKIMATLGVAATLGISCIPMFATHAAAGDHAASATIKITVAEKVESGWEDTDGNGLIDGFTGSLNPGEYITSNAIKTTLATTAHNVGGGYKLIVYGSNTGKTETNALYHSDGTHKISTASGEFGTITSGTKGTASKTGWGIQAVNATSPASGAMGDSWTAIPASKADATATGAAPLAAAFGTEGNTTYNVYYGFAIKSDDQSVISGDYTGNITFEIVPNA